MKYNVHFFQKKYFLTLFILTALVNIVNAQLHWQPVDSVNKKLPNGVRLYYTNNSLDGEPNIAYYLEADLNNKLLQFDVDTTLNRRLTPTQFYNKNEQPLLVVNCTFFAFETNKNQNVVIKNGKVVGHNIKYVQRKQNDSTIINIPINRSALGITKKRKADVAWLQTDSSKRYATAKQSIATTFNPIIRTDVNEEKQNENIKNEKAAFKKSIAFKKWKMQTAIGGGPVLIQGSEIKITNNEEQLFTGKAINDKHPRTAMGYTKDNKLIVLVIQGRFANIANGASLLQEAKIMKDIGCVEALNLDGGGSSCMLVNGQETIKPSDKTGQRPVPAVFLIKYKK